MRHLAIVSLSTTNGRDFKPVRFRGRQEGEPFSGNAALSLQHLSMKNFMLELSMLSSEVLVVACSTCCSSVGPIWPNLLNCPKASPKYMLGSAILICLE